MTEPDKNHLISRIDELEHLLAKKKAESQQLPKLKVDTDGIPVLVDSITEKGINPDVTQALDSVDKNDQIINDIIDKVDKEISEDLDELIAMLKDSIIDEVKTRLLEKLHANKSQNKQ